MTWSLVRSKGLKNNRSNTSPERPTIDKTNFYIEKGQVKAENHGIGILRTSFRIDFLYFKYFSKTKVGSNHSVIIILIH